MSLDHPPAAAPSGTTGVELVGRTPDPSGTIETRTADQGRSLTIRPMRPDDLDALSGFISGLSERSRHHRWGARKLQPDELARLTQVDPGRTRALVASEWDGVRGRIVGEARHVRDTDGRACEFALVVADRRQGRGLGEQLLQGLIDGARRAGIHRMYGTTLRINAPMLRLAKKLGFRTRMRPGDVGVIELSLALER